MPLSVEIIVLYLKAQKMKISYKIKLFCIFEIVVKMAESLENKGFYKTYSIEKCYRILTYCEGCLYSINSPISTLR